MSNPDPLVVTLPLSALRALLFGDENLEGIKPLTPIIGDTAKVLVIPRAIGELIAELDKEEFYFHVELLFTTHAELWLAFEWKESNVRRARLCRSLATEKATRTRDATRLAELTATIRGQFAAPDGYLAELARTILDNYTKMNLSDVLTAINVAELLEKYRKEDNEQQENHH